MCEHREVSDFAVFSIRMGQKEQVQTLAKCISCGELLTLDSEIVPESSIIARLTLGKENMRTMVFQLNSDLYDKIMELIEREDVGGDPSKIVNELIGLGLHHYSRIHERGLKGSTTTVPA